VTKRRRYEFGSLPADYFFDAQPIHTTLCIALPQECIDVPPIDVCSDMSLHQNDYAASEDMQTLICVTVGGYRRRYD